jgi:hypothetical protein
MQDAVNHCFTAIAFHLPGWKDFFRLQVKDIAHIPLLRVQGMKLSFEFLNSGESTMAVSRSGRSISE